jgi:hypothetical protein
MEGMMNIDRIRGRIAMIAALLVVLYFAAPAHSAAQEAGALSSESAARMEDAASGEGISWWVVGTGGVLGSGSSQGDLLSATVGQTAIDMASDRATVTAYLGYWLPEFGSVSEVEPRATSGTVGESLLLTNHPNPFSGSTMIEYLLRERGHVRLRVFDMTGRQVRLLLDGEEEAGEHSLNWDALDDHGGVLPTGIYFSMLEMNSDGVDPSSPSGIRLRRAMYLVR